MSSSNRAKALGDDCQHQTPGGNAWHSIKVYADYEKQADGITVIADMSNWTPTFCPDCGTPLTQENENKMPITHSVSIHSEPIEISQETLTENAILKERVAMLEKVVRDAKQWQQSNATNAAIAMYLFSLREILETANV